MEFIVADRGEVERGIVVRAAYVVISITDPGSPVPRIRKPTGFREALHLQFHDAVPVAGSSLPADIVPMTSDQAREIWEFVLRCRDQVDTVVVHCEQGMSRSPAVAAALAGQLGGNNDRFFLEYHPNEYIYGLMCSVAPGTNSC